MGNNIVVSKQALENVISGIKSLNVVCDRFEEADKWVGLVLYLEQLVSNGVPTQKTEKEVNSDVTD